MTQLIKFHEGVHCGVPNNEQLTVKDTTTHRSFVVSVHEAPMMQQLIIGVSKTNLQRLLDRAGLTVSVEQYLALYDDECLIERGDRLHKRVRDKLDQERWLALLNTLKYAKTQLRYYADVFAKADINLEVIKSFSGYEQKVPLLDRATYIENFPKGFIPTSHAYLSLLANPDYRITQSSGTTDNRVQIIHQRQYLSDVFCSTYGYDDIFDKRHAIFAPHQCIDVNCNTGVPTFSERYTGHALLMATKDVMEQTPNQALALLNELVMTNIHRLVANPYYLAMTLFRATKVGSLPTISKVYLGYDYCQQTTRYWLAQKLGLQPLDIYGMSECGYQLVRSCEHGSLHLNEEFFHFEFLPMPDLQSHRLVVSTLRNQFSPLLRYVTDDLFQLSTDQERCQCGSVYGVVDGFDGRMTDLVSGMKTSHPFGRVDRMIGAIDGVIMYKLTQHKHCIYFHYVSDGAANEIVSEKVTPILFDLLGVDEVICQSTLSLRLGKGNKFHPFEVI